MINQEQKPVSPADKPVQEQVQKQTPEPSKKPKLPNWASILIIVIAAIIVVGLVSWGGYELFKPTPSKLPEAGDVEEDEFKDWKTYQSEQYNIEFKYSQRLSVKEFKTVHNEGVSINFPSGSILNYSIGPYYDVAGDKSTITIDNKDYDMWHRISDETETYDIVLGAKKAIDFINRGSTDDYELFQKILSTFKFLEPEISANWKTYQNEEYGWEIQYPREGYEFKDFTYSFRIEDGSGKPVIEMEILSDRSDKESFKDFAVDCVKTSCGASGPPGGDWYCTDVVEQGVYTNKNNITGYEIYMTRVYELDTVEEQGPEGGFVFEIPESTDKRAIYFKVGSYSYSETNLNLLKKMIDTFKFF